MMAAVFHTVGNIIGLALIGIVKDVPVGITVDLRRDTKFFRFIFNHGLNLVSDFNFEIIRSYQEVHGGQ